MALELTRKPAGGYILFQAHQLLSAWEAYRTKIIRLVDLRVWLACHELVARRQGAPKGHPVRYQLTELGALVGNPSARTLRGSLNRLERAGLAQWSDVAITFRDREASTTCQHLTSPKRLVPVPRRVGRFLASGTTRAITATMLGLLVRCVFYRRGVCSSTGACKASWVAETFGVDERSVKRARARLIALGWVEPVEATQWRLNRWGGVYRVNLAWDGGTKPRSHLTPQVLGTASRLSPPDSDKQPLREYIHQKPVGHGRSGVRGYRKATPEPSLWRIEPEDLGQTTRLESLHAEACARGQADPSEAGRLRFMALAAHARSHATRNAPGLFAWLLRGQRWGFITQADEDGVRHQSIGNRARSESSRAFVTTGMIVESVLAEVRARRRDEASARASLPLRR